MVIGMLPLIIPVCEKSILLLKHIPNQNISVNDALSSDPVRIMTGEDFVLICKICVGDSLDRFFESVTLKV